MLAQLTLKHWSETVRYLEGYLKDLSVFFLYTDVIMSGNFLGSS